MTEFPFSRTKGLVALFLLLLTSLALGCNRDTSSSNEIVISPSIIDFGEVCATGQDIQENVSIANVSSRTLQIKITPSCGCLVASELDFELAAGENREFPLLLSSYGRSGDFNSQLLVRYSQGASKVPVTATFISEVFATPSRVLLLTSDGSLAGEFKIQAPPRLWQELSIDYDERELEVELIEADITKGLRRYRIIAKTIANSYQPIAVTKEGQVKGVMNIPVIRGID